MSKILTLGLNSSIKQAFKELNKFSEYGMIVNIMSAQKKIIGVVTEGDLRRSILKGFSIDTKLKEIINKKFFFLYDSEIKSKKINNPNFNSTIISKVSYFPVVDNNMRLKQVLHVRNLKKIMGGQKMILNKVKQQQPIILVVGGGGFIGSVLTKKLLKENYKVKVLDNFFYEKKSLLNLKKDKKLTIIKRDVSDLSSQIIAIKDVECVIFLAELVGDPLCRKNPEDAIKTNYLALSSMANLCQYMNINKFIYTSSCSVYGSSQKKMSLIETSSLNPLSLYARIKIMSEQSLLSYTSKNFSPTILRLATVYGSSLRQRFDLVVNTFIKNAYFKKKIVVDGDGKQFRPNIHVEDVADAIIKIIKSPTKKVKNQIFNLCNEKENLSILQLAKRISSKFKDCKIIFNPRKTDNRDYYVSANKIKKTLDFKTKLSIEKAINDLKIYFDKNKSQNFDKSKFINLKSYLSK